MLKDTVRILVDWKCNLKCAYCCNEQERFRKNILPIKLEDIDFSKYKFVCISGGEPLLFMERIKAVADKAREHGAFIIIYSNGIYWTTEKAIQLKNWGIDAANIGLHFPTSFHSIIHRVELATLGLPISVRYHVWDKYKSEMEEKYPAIPFRFWTLNDCDRDNEDRFVLTIS